MKWSKTLWLLVLIFVFSACKKDNNRAFYATDLSYLSNNELAEKLKIEAFYVPCFDVIWSGGYGFAIPVHSIYEDNQNWNHWSYQPKAPYWNYPSTFQINPVVNIQNNVFHHTESSELATLATRILWRIPFRYKVKEIQINCDWTDSTKERYFEFLKVLKSKLRDKQKLSVVVDWQHFQESEKFGIPPVDRAMLWCFNVANPADINTKNSVLDATVVNQVLEGKAYDLPLDITLPFFYLGVLFRNNEFIGFLDNFNPLEFQLKPGFYHQNKSYYTLVKNRKLGEVVCQKGDIIRLDGSHKAELEQTILVLKQHLNLKNSRITFFDWNTNLHEYENDLENYYSMLR